MAARRVPKRPLTMDCNDTMTEDDDRGERLTPGETGAKAEQGVRVQANTTPACEV